MPISRDEFARGRKLDALQEGVIAYLRQNSEKAYTFNEILQAMNNREPGREETLGVINSMLLFYTIENAIHNELLVSKSFEGERYYTVP